MERPGYLDDYLALWSARPEVDRIWPSLYTPQVGEDSPQMLTPQQRREFARQAPILKARYPALLMTPGIAAAMATPPASPQECVFSRVSVNYSADLTTRVEPCFYGGNPDCSQCGCAVTAGLHWIGSRRLLGSLTASHVMEASITTGRGASSAHRGRL